MERASRIKVGFGCANYDLINNGLEFLFNFDIAHKLAFGHICTSAIIQQKSSYRCGCVLTVFVEVARLGHCPN